ncbi:MAG: carbamoyltransferase HypF [Armatimonadetes bacterium]|nr:carbamoyltransferase HypF [Armatimonadota bacterium]
MTDANRSALRVHVRGVVQGVGFRPFVYRTARRHGLAGWVRNAPSGVEIYLEGPGDALAAFLDDLRGTPPPAARIVSVQTVPVPPEGAAGFTIDESRRRDSPTARISPDLAVCDACLEELFTPTDRRSRYPYINCTNCGPRHSIILGLPYDRPLTTMKDWEMCADCAREYDDPADRRFHAQPIACPACGPHYCFEADGVVRGRGEAAMTEAAAWLRAGRIIAIKGVGGYHLACDARSAKALRELRERKFRKEKPFALMARDLGCARDLVTLTAEGEALLTSPARPIVLAPARVDLPGVAPDNTDLGVMLPYAPLHYLLYAAGAPEVLVMTSANRSEEPIAYLDGDARERLGGIADAFLAGERPIARRVEDSVVRAGPAGPAILRRSRGYAPGAVAVLPAGRPILAVGADLKNTVTLVVDGAAFTSPHIGDLDHTATFAAFQETIRDLCAMYEVDVARLLVVGDLHPQYASTTYARELPGEHLEVQHHRAHVASVLAEREAWDVPVVGVAFDGTGYGDDGGIWGGEIFTGTLRGGLRRVGHLRPAALPGGDAAARFPVQAAAGFLAQVPNLPDLTRPPFNFPGRYHHALELVAKGVRTFPTTSMGRLFDTAAALVGFTREITFEGQAAIWLEHLARQAPPASSYPFPVEGDELDFRPLLHAVAEDRARGRDAGAIARAFHEAVAAGVARVCLRWGEETGARRVALSGGVFQNALLLTRVGEMLSAHGGLEVWVNQNVPTNDGGISLGQAAVAAVASGEPAGSHV